MEVATCLVLEFHGGDAVHETMMTSGSVRRGVGQVGTKRVQKLYDIYIYV